MRIAVIYIWIVSITERENGSNGVFVAGEQQTGSIAACPIVYPIRLSSNELGVVTRSKEG